MFCYSKVEKGVREDQSHVIFPPDTPIGYMVVKRLVLDDMIYGLLDSLVLCGILQMLIARTEDTPALSLQIYRVIGSPLLISPPWSN